MKIAFLTDFDENDGWKETKYIAGNIAVMHWTSMRLSL